MRQHPDHNHHMAQHFDEMEQEAQDRIQNISEKEGEYWVVGDSVMHYTDIPDRIAPRVLDEYERDLVNVCEDESKALSQTI